jgi:hypothetical protein
MQVLVIHSTETEQIMGMVSPKKPVDFDKFDDEVRRTWKLFHDDNVRNSWAEENNIEFDDDCEYSGLTIEDFVEFHNSKSEMEIDWVVSDFIQL